MPLTTSIDDLFASASEQATTASAGDQTPQVIYTGRYIAIFKDDVTDEAVAQFQQSYSLNVASAASFDGQAVAFEDLGEAEVLVLPNVGVALISAEAYAAMSAPSPAVAQAGTDGTTGGTTGGSTSGATSGAPVLDPNGPIESLEPEFFLFAIDDSTGDGTGTATAPATAPATTYGLDITAVTQCARSGNGIKIAILDTGFDLSHPDFAGRSIVSASFVGQPVQDGHGHGTHTAGTACGPQNPGAGIPRYGVAYDSSMYIGKVLTDSGRATSGSVLAGINWALTNKCDIVSMSLSAPAGVQASYTKAGTKALAAGTLLIAAAGNDSNRPGTIANTGAPANSPSIMSVAAVDQSLNIAPFSNGGKIEIAGPGVLVFSSLPAPVLHGDHFGSLPASGTSMATPHVSGIAALWAEGDPALRGQSLWSVVTAGAQTLTLPNTDVGGGLVQAPTTPPTSQP